MSLRVRFRFLFAPSAALTVLLAGCGQTAAPPAPTQTRPPVAAPATVQVPPGLSPLPKPSASPSASPAAAGALPAAVQRSTSARAQQSPSCTSGKPYADPPPMVIDINKHYSATITTSLGAMKADLFPSEAPQTVDNFVFLARQGFYDGVIFHRVIEGFMAQGGDPTGTGAGGPGYCFNDEPVTRNYERGILAMANSGPSTNGSQFFVVQKLYSPPTKAYTIFGQLTDGLDTLDKIVASPKASDGQSPITKITITTIKIDET